jgi:hypothetical protein
MRAGFVRIEGSVQTVSVRLDNSNVSDQAQRTELTQCSCCIAVESHSLLLSDLFLLPVAQTRAFNRHVVQSSPVALRALSPLQKLVAGNGNEPLRWTPLRQDIRDLVGRANGDAMMTNALGGHRIGDVNINIGTVPAFGPFDPAGPPATPVQVSQITEVNIILFRLFYNEEFGILPGDDVETMRNKFMSWLQHQPRG